MTRRRRLAALAFAALSTGALAREAPPRDAAIAELWAQTLAQGDLNKILGTYRDAALVYSEGAVVDAQLCKEHKSKIDAATQINPVGLGVWRIAWRCAEATGENTLAAQRRRHLEALLRHAFRSVSPDGGRTPIRVISEADVTAVIAESGLETIDLYYDETGDRRHLSLFVTLFDADSGTERQLAFDLLDARMEILRDRPGMQYPSARLRIADALLKHNSEVGSIAATRILQLRTMLQADAGKIGESFDQAVRDNNKVAIYALAMLCMTRSEKFACGTRHIDALLPYAERRHSPALAWLAQAYRTGTGVPRNDAAARTLLDGADRRAGGVGGRLRLIHWLRRHGDESSVLPADLRGPIEAAARRGDLAAQLALVDAANTPAQAAGWSALQRDSARRAAEAGSAAGQFAWSLRLSAERRDDDAMQWLRRAAANDETRAQAALAQHYSRSATADDTKKALHWFARAAHGGDAASMLFLGRHYLRLPTPDYAAAAGWFESGAQANDVDSAIALARLYAEGAGSVARDEARAIALLRPISDDPDRPDARTLLVWLLRFGRDIEHDLGEAERILRHPADSANSAMQHLLADLLLQKPTTPERVAEAVALLRRAAPSNDNAKGQLARQLWYGLGVERDTAAARALWEPVVEKGSGWWINEYAWALCTAVDASVEDGRKGLDAFARRKDEGALQPAHEDTFAACQALVGDFDAAVRSQQHALDGMTLAKPDASATIAALRARLELYKAGKPYREAVAGK